MPQTEDLKVLRALNARFIHNFVSNDAKGHSEIIHPRFICINSNGSRTERAPYLHDWQSDFDPNVIVYWDTRNETIDIFGDVALVRSTNKWIRVIDGEEKTGMTTYTDTYIRENGKWQCIQAQLTPVAPEAYPPDSSIVSVYIKGVRQA